MDSRAPPLYRFVADRSGQSNVVAVALIAGMTIIGTGVVVALGSSALDDTKSHASLALNEQSMSKFDAEAALVALGRSDTRSVTLGDAGGGTYEVNPDQSWLRITHHNYSGAGRTETIYNASLGAFVYENGDTTIAYEGGGVWRTQEGGGTVMVSPPEFRYRSATLTLPVVRVRGQGGGGGTSPRATITSVEQARRVYGNTSASADGNPEVGAPYNVTEAPYDNPLQNGTVSITVHSPHYGGWADYFRTRTEGNVSVDHANGEVSVELTTPGDAVGAFEMPAEGNSLEVPAMASDHPVNQFTMNLSADNNFQNGHWEMYYDTPTEDFSLHVKANDQCQGGDYDGEVELTIYYNGDGSGDYQAWQESLDPDSSSAVSVTCLDGNGNQPEEYIELTLTSTEDIEYREPDTTGNDNKYYFEPDMEDGSLRDPHDPSAHSADSVVGTLNSGDEAELEWIINHYFSLLGPQFTLTITDGPGGSSRVNEESSEGVLNYGTVSGSEYIQYLHVTENEVRVVVSA
ncbi:MAG: hypothetical protein ABEJ61_08145 [Haloferacaceae archaeon]